MLPAPCHVSLSIYSALISAIVKPVAFAISSKFMPNFFKIFAFLLLFILYQIAGAIASVWCANYKKIVAFFSFLLYC